MSARAAGWRAAHGVRWYDDPLYRLAWLILPQGAGVLIVLGILNALSSPDTWGEPASTKEMEKKFVDLVDKAGKAGDRAAFDEMTKAAEAGGIAANSILAHLYDPSDAGLFPKNPAQPDPAKALKMYRVAADAGYPGGQRGVIALTLTKSYSTYDLKQGCKYAMAFYANPLAIQVKYFEEWGTLSLIAGCFVDESSGVPRNLDKAASIYLDSVAGKHKATVSLLTDKLAIQPRDLVIAIQQNLKQRGLYYGAADGAVTPQTLDAIRTLSGDVAKPPIPPAAAPPRPAATAPPSAEVVMALFEQAKTDRTSEIKLRFMAEAGDAKAQLLYGMLFAPAYKAERTNVLDARRAMTYFEPLSQRGFGAAAAWAALLYDTGYPELPRNATEAAAYAMRALELQYGDMVPMLEKNSWSAGFWSELQRQLSRRNLYSGTIVDRRNDRAILAARRLAQGG